MEGRIAAIVNRRAYELRDRGRIQSVLVSMFCLFYFVVVGNRLVKKMCMIRRRNAESCVSMGMMDSYLMNNICCRSSFLCLYFCDWCLHRVVT